MAGVNNFNLYAPVNQAGGGQNKESAVKNQPDKTEDRFSQVMKDTVKSKGKEDGKTKGSAQTSEKTPEKKPVEEQPSELKQGEVVPLADLGLIQAMGEAAVPVQSIFTDRIIAEPEVPKEHQLIITEGTDLPGADRHQGGKSLADAGFLMKQEGKIPVATSQAGDAAVPTDVLPKPQTVNSEVPVTTTVPQPEVPKTEPVIAEQQVQVMEMTGKDVPAGKEVLAGKEVPVGKDVPTGKEVLTGEIKQSSHEQSTEIRPEETAAVKPELASNEGKQPLEAGTVKDSDTLDIHILQQMMKEPVSVMPQTEEVVRVKVAEPFNRMDENLVKRLGNKVTESLLDGKKELTIQLDPEHLGKISIKISIASEGVKVLLSCDNQKTLGLLAERSDGIGHIIENNMKSPVVVEVKEDNFWNQQKNATDQHANQNGRQQEERKENKADESDGFLQQMRLGLLEERLVV